MQTFHTAHQVELIDFSTIIFLLFKLSKPLKYILQLISKAISHENLSFFGPFIFDIFKFNEIKERCPQAQMQTTLSYISSNLHAKKK